MKLTVTQENLTKALTAVSRATTSRAGLPILANILLKTDSNRLLVAATNLEIASLTYVGAKVEKTGEITVPAKILTDYVANLPKKPIDIEVKLNSITLVCDGYTSTIRGIGTEDFPELPSIDEKKSIAFDLDVDDFKKTIAQVLFACSNDITRPVLTGVLWHSLDGDLYAVGTDGYRLAERRVTKTSSEFQAIIPASTLQEVSRLIHDDTEKIEMFFDETQVEFRLGDNKITSRLIDGKYPDYRQLIPKNADITIEVSTTELARTAKIANLFAREVGGSITLEADEGSQKLSIKSVTSEVGDNTAVIGSKISNSGSISLNSRFLSDVLSVVDTSEVEISFSGKLSPIKLIPKAKDSNYLHIIMPLKS